MGSSLVEEKKGLPGGVILTDTGKRVNILDRKEDNYWDTILIWDGVYPGAFAIPANTIVPFFRRVSTKGRHYSAFNVDNQIIGNEQILITKLGFVPRLKFGNVNVRDVDIKFVLEAAYSEFRKNENVKKKGPSVFWQAGYGITGATQEGAPVGDFFCSIGVPSPAAIPDLLKPFELYDDDNVECDFTFPNSQIETIASAHRHYAMPTIETPVPITLVMHGFIVRSGLRD